MNDIQLSGRKYWSISRSIALELDLSLDFLNKKAALIGLSAEATGLVKMIPEEWLSAWRELWGEAQAPHDLMEISAFLAGSLLGDDYGQVTRNIRELTAESVHLRVLEQADALGLSMVNGASQVINISDLFSEVVVKTFTQAGLTVNAESEHIQHVRKSINAAFRIIAGGDLHTRFWQLLDQYYYEFYRLWRETRLPSMQGFETQTRAALGADDQVPSLEWMPAQNPLLRFPELQIAVLSGKIPLTFWSEPFGMADSLSLWPGQLIVSFAQAGSLYENFTAFAQDVAARASALGDPTRLIILRIIRNFGMFNTEIAKFLELSQPTVSIHTKILRDAGLIQSKQEGRLVRHEVNIAEVRRLFTDLERLLDMPEK